MTKFSLCFPCAARPFSKAGKSGKDFPDYRLQFGKALAGAKLHDRALKQYEMALAKAPKDVRVLASRSRLYAQLEKAIWRRPTRKRSPRSASPNRKPPRMSPGGRPY